MPRNRRDRRRVQSKSFLGPALTVISADVEGSSTAKQNILAELCSNLHCDVLCLQETHRGSDNNRPSIPGMVLAGLCQKIVMDPIPSSQHRPIGIQVNAAIKPISVPFKRRFNYKKADWKGFTDELEQKVKRIAPISCNYDHFAELDKKTARRHIPRGCRVEYVPGLSKESSELYEEYVTMFEEDPFSDETTEAGEKVMESISQEYRKTWNALIESTDCQRTAKKLGLPSESFMAILKHHLYNPKSLQIKLLINCY